MADWRGEGVCVLHCEWLSSVGAYKGGMYLQFLRCACCQKQSPLSMPYNRHHHHCHYRYFLPIPFFLASASPELLSASRVCMYMYLFQFLISRTKSENQRTYYVVDTTASAKADNRPGASTGHLCGHPVREYHKRYLRKSAPLNPVRPAIFNKVLVG